MGVLLAMPCFGEEGDRPSAGSMVYAVTYCTVFSVVLHHTTQHVRPSQLFVGQRARWRVSAAIGVPSLTHSTSSSSSSCQPKREACP